MIITSRQNFVNQNFESPWVYLSTNFNTSADLDATVKNIETLNSCFDNFANAVMHLETLESYTYRPLESATSSCKFTVERVPPTPWQSERFKIVKYNYLLDLVLDIVTFSIHYFYKNNEAYKLLKKFSQTDIINYPKVLLPKTPVFRKEISRIDLAKRGLNLFIKRWNCESTDAAKIHLKNIEIEHNQSYIQSEYESVVTNYNDCETKNLQTHNSNRKNLSEQVTRLIDTIEQQNLRIQERVDQASKRPVKVNTIDPIYEKQLENRLKMNIARLSGLKEHLAQIESLKQLRFWYAVPGGIL